MICGCIGFSREFPGARFWLAEYRIWTEEGGRLDPFQDFRRAGGDDTLRRFRGAAIHGMDLGDSD